MRRITSVQGTLNPKNRGVQRVIYLGRPCCSRKKHTDKTGNWIATGSSAVADKHEKRIAHEISTIWRGDTI